MVDPLTAIEEQLLHALLPQQPGEQRDLVVSYAGRIVVRVRMIGRAEVRSLTGIVAPVMTVGAMERRGLLVGETLPARDETTPRYCRWTLSELGEDVIREIFPFGEEVA